MRGMLRVKASAGCQQSVFGDQFSARPPVATECAC